MPDLIFPGQLPSGNINQGLPANYDLALWQGDAVKFTLAFTNTDGTAMDLSTWTAAASMRANFSSETLYDFSCSVSDATGGKVLVYLPSSTSKTIPAGGYVWSFEMTDSAGTFARSLPGTPPCMRRCQLTDPTTPTTGWENLKEYVKSTDADDTLIQWVWTDAVALVSAFVGTATVPDSVYTHACLMAGMNLFQARVAQNGIVGFNGQDRPMFAPKDPLYNVYPLLVRYVGRF